jgi:tetratricopeptide (TPR) repeat protein
MADPAATQPDPAEPLGLLRGTTVRYFGDYEIRQELGQGGMGIVYEARQISLNRLVALKIVRAGLLASDDELRRFRNEAEAVALLDHPGIVPVYEVGEHDGHPYFSMKLVAGGSLVPLLDRYRDDPKAAAQLVAEAAEAVAHAHMRGILHRDLKPANILVDEHGHPHVTDFGLAKRIAADVEITASGLILGTPAYMSPEQADGRRGTITTATDVYGLGAVLYALLTGKAPFGGMSAAETLEAVRTRPPDRPGRLSARVPRDLETICLKCLEKDARRRYATAQALCDDLRAWLSSRPIMARRTGASERAWLWCQRKPAIAALAAGIVLTLVAGTAAVIAVQARANRALSAKNTDLTTALGREGRANSALVAANRQALERYGLAVESIETFHTGVSEDFLLDQDQFKELRDRLLKSAGDFYGKLAGLLDQQTDRASREALARASFELARLTEQVGDRKAALEAFRAVLARREALAAEPGADLETRADVGRCLIRIAVLLDDIGQSRDALPVFRQAESLLASLVVATPPGAPLRNVLAGCQGQMGQMLARLGKRAAAQEALEASLAGRRALVRARPGDVAALHSLVLSLNLFAEFQDRGGRSSDALAAFDEGAALLDRLATAATATTEQRYTLAHLLGRRGALKLRLGRPAEAEADLRKALPILEGLAGRNPAVTRFRGSLAFRHQTLAEFLEQTGRLQDAETELREAIAIHQKLADENPAVVDHVDALGGHHTRLASVLERLGKAAEAETEFRQALGFAGRLLALNAGDVGFHSHLASAHHNLGGLLYRTGKAREAEAEYRQALEIHQKVADQNPAVTDYRTKLATTRYSLGVLLAHMGRKTEAEAEYRQTLLIE